MKPSALLLSAFHFLLTSFFMMLGVFFIGLGKTPHMKDSFIQFFKVHPDLLSLIGIGILFFGAILFVVFFHLYKKVFYQLEMKSGSIQIDPSIIASYAVEQIHSVTKKRPISCEVVIGKDQKLEIITRFAKDATIDQENFFKIEQALANVLSKKLNYQSSFLFTLLE